MSPQEFVALTASRLRRLVHFDTCALYLRDHDLLHARFVEGEYAAHFEDLPIPLGEGISGWAAQNARPLLNGNASVEPGAPMLPNGSPALRSGTALPLLDAGGQAFAVLTLYSVHEDAFSVDDVQVLNAMEPQLALVLRDALQKALQGREDERDAGREASTGLPDAGHLFLQLEKQLALAEETQHNFAVLVCALDPSDGNPDGYGKRCAPGKHDRTASSLAEALRQLCRPTEFVAGLSGGEFVFLLPAIDKAGLESRIVAIRSLAETRAPRSAQGPRPAIAIGAATFPWDGFTAETLLAAASRRLHGDREVGSELTSGAQQHGRAVTVAR